MSTVELKVAETKSHNPLAQVTPAVVGSRTTDIEPVQGLASPSPFTPRAGSTPSASAAEDDSPRKISIRNQRILFMSAPPRTKTSLWDKTTVQSNCQATEDIESCIALVCCDLGG